MGRLVKSPHANARIKSIDASGAEKTPGVRGVVLIKDIGDELQWVGAEIAAIAADTEEIARDAVENFKVEYEVLPHVVKDEDLNKVGNRAKPGQDNTEGDMAKGFQEADETHEGYYGSATITHCCLEPHGNTVHWKGEKDITVWASTQAVGRIGADLAKNLSADPSLPKVSPSDIHVITPVMGGGFGSKFNIDSWGIAAAKLSRMTGRPVKIMLDRDEELMVAGGRPSWYGKVKVGAKKDGTLTAFECESWATSGMGRGSNTFRGSALRLHRDAEPSRAAHQRDDQHRSGACLAGAATSADRGDHSLRADGFGREDEDRPGRFLQDQRQVHSTARCLFEPSSTRPPS